MPTQSNKIDFNGQHFYVGFDVHLKSWKVTIMTEKLILKTFSQDPKPELLHQHLVRNYPNGIYHSAYEAGFCGYWIHNKLKALGIDSIVVGYSGDADPPCPVMLTPHKDYGSENLND